MSEHAHADLKTRAREELVEFVTISLYLLLVFGAFMAYRRLILSELGVSKWKYGFAIVEALVLAKIVLVGQALGIGRWLARGPLAWVASYKSLAFSLLVAVLTLAERAVEGELHHENPFQAMFVHGVSARDEALARSLMMFVAFVPFFALTELQRRYRLPGLGKLLFGEAPADDG